LQAALTFSPPDCCGPIRAGGRGGAHQILRPAVRRTGYRVKKKKKKKKKKEKKKKKSKTKRKEKNTYTPLSPVPFETPSAPWRAARSDGARSRQNSRRR
jgi:hypothetical protein